MRAEYVLVNGECPRCPTMGFASPASLEAHFREHHAMARFQAHREAALAFAGKLLTPDPGVPVLPDITAEHVCPKCDYVIPCDAELIAAYRRHARVTVGIANHLERKRQGLPGANRKNHDWTTEQARELLAKGLSFRAIGLALGADDETVKRAILNGNGTHGR